MRRALKALHELRRQGPDGVLPGGMDSIMTALKEEFHRLPESDIFHKTVLNLLCCADKTYGNRVHMPYWGICYIQVCYIQVLLYSSVAIFKCCYIQVYRCSDF